MGPRRAVCRERGRVDQSGLTVCCARRRTKAIAGENAKMWLLFSSRSKCPRRSRRKLQTSVRRRSDGPLIPLHCNAFFMRQQERDAGGEKETPEAGWQGFHVLLAVQPATQSHLLRRRTYADATHDGTSPRLVCRVREQLVRHRDRANAFHWDTRTNVADKEQQEQGRFPSGSSEGMKERKEGRRGTFLLEFVGSLLPPLIPRSYVIREQARCDSVPL